MMRPSRDSRLRHQITVYGFFVAALMVLALFAPVSHAKPSQTRHFGHSSSASVLGSEDTGRSAVATVGPVQGDDSIMATKANGRSTEDEVQEDLLWNADRKVGVTTTHCLCICAFYFLNPKNFCETKHAIGNK